MALKISWDQEEKTVESSNGASAGGGQDAMRLLENRLAIQQSNT